MFQRSPKRGVCASEFATPLRQDDGIWDERGHSACGQALQRRLAAVGLWLVSGSLVSGLLCQVMWVIDVDRLVPPKDIASEDIEDLPNQQRVGAHLTHVIADVRGLGLAVQRRRCRDCRQVQCPCVVWRVDREGRRA